MAQKAEAILATIITQIRTSIYLTSLPAGQTVACLVVLWAGGLAAVGLVSLGRGVFWVCDVHGTQWSTPPVLDPYFAVPAIDQTAFCRRHGICSFV